MPERLRSAFSGMRRRCVHLPIVTITAIAAVLITAQRYHVFASELPLDVAFRYGFSARALSMGHWSTLVTSQFLTRDPFMAVSIAVSLALMLGVYEAIAGAKRTLVVACVTALAGPLLVAGALGIGNALGSGFASSTLSTLDYGASAVTAGAGGALVAVVGSRRLRWFALFWVLTGVLLHHQLADWEHVGSFVTGYGLGRVLGVAPAAGIVRRRVGGFTRSWLRPRVLAIPVLVLGTVVGSALGAAVVPARHAAVSVAGGRHLAQAALGPARVIEMSYPTPSIGGTRHAFIVLPAGYDGSRSRYPVVEVLHGSPGAPSDIIVGFDPIGVMAQPGIPAFIGVVPDGRGPVVASGEFADTSKQRLGAAVSNDLRHWIDRRYRTNGHWGVMGLSAGGYGAAYLGSRAPAHYDTVCSLSGNFTPQGTAFQAESRTVLDLASPILHARPNGPRTLLVTGSSDPGSVRESLVYAQALQRARQTYERVVVPGGHSWVMWKREFPRCLRFMLAHHNPAIGTNRPQRASRRHPTAENSARVKG